MAAEVMKTDRRVLGQPSGDRDHDTSGRDDREDCKLTNALSRTATERKSSEQRRHFSVALDEEIVRSW